MLSQIIALGLWVTYLTLSLKFELIVELTSQDYTTNEKRWLYKTLSPGSLSDSTVFVHCFYVMPCLLHPFLSTARTSSSGKLQFQKSLSQSGPKWKELYLLHEMWNSLIIEKKLQICPIHSNSTPKTVFLIQSSFIPDGALCYNTAREEAKNSLWRHWKPQAMLTLIINLTDLGTTWEMSTAHLCVHPWGCFQRGLTKVGPSWILAPSPMLVVLIG